MGKYQQLGPSDDDATIPVEGEEQNDPKSNKKRKHGEVSTIGTF